MRATTSSVGSDSFAQCNRAAAASVGVALTPGGGMEAVHEIEYAVPVDRHPRDTAVAHQSTGLFFENAADSEPVPLPMSQPLRHQRVDALELRHQIRRVVLDDCRIRQD